MSQMFPRKNTLKFEFDMSTRSVQPSYIEVHDWIVDVIGITSDQVHTAYYDLEQYCFYVKLLNPVLMERILLKYEGGAEFRHRDQTKMISSFETQRPVWTLCLLLLGAVYSCSGLPHRQTDKMADQMQSTSKMTKQQQTAAVDLDTLLDAGDGVIVSLVAGETRVAVHRAVLAAGSPVLAAMLRPGTPESCSGEVAVLDVEGPVLRQLVAFLYTGRVPQLPGMALPLLVAAEKYDLPGLRDICEQLVADQLSVQNAVATAVLAVRHNYPSLKQAAVCFIKEHLEVMTTEGWVYAVHNHPGEVVEFTRLLADTCGAATTDCRPATTATVPTAAPTTAATTAATTVTTTAATTATTTAATTAATTTTTTAATTAATTATTTAATTTTTTAATTTATMLPTAPMPDPAAVSRYRSLSADAKAGRLKQAAIQGAVEEVRALLSAGAAVDARDGGGWTALHWAADYGKTAVVGPLLAAGAQINARDLRGWTPLHWAAVRGRAEAAAALLEAGADRWARDNEGRTALDLARQNSHNHVVQLLQ